MRSQEEIFADVRPELMNVARRMLGNPVEAEDMVQETCLRWERAATTQVRSPKAFLTTIVTRLCLNHLDLARVRLEHEDAPLLLESLPSETRNPAEHAEFADALSEALQTVLANLSPTERVVFLLREAFEFDYADIALVVNRSEENCRQILSRARERLAARKSFVPPAGEQNQHVVSEFLNAAQTGQFDQLLQLLSDGAALAPAPADLSQPAPPLIHDRKAFVQTLGKFLGQMREGSERFVVLRIGRDYACVARSGSTARAAILMGIREQKVATVRLVKCPALLSRLGMLMAASPGGADQPKSTYRSN
jgi:RNA polymerase sigma-70 factor (ECF subfamily)